jgi:hypothetical protein
MSISFIYPYSGSVLNPASVVLRSPERNEILSYDIGTQATVTQDGKIIVTSYPYSAIKTKIRMQFSDIKYEQYRQLLEVMTRYLAASSNVSLAIKMIDSDSVQYKVKPVGSEFEGTINADYNSVQDAYSFSLILEILP